MIAPLAEAFAMYSNPLYRDAALKCADTYAARHLSMDEPYWGGTLDARYEDKEGAWAALQGFMAAYDLTGDKKYLGYAKHAAYVVLTYAVVWDIPMPPSRLADKRFRSRGWTSVSAQNHHLDVYGVLCAPKIFRLGRLLGDSCLEDFSELMFRSCGQLVEFDGSQGEQIQNTAFCQYAPLEKKLGRHLRGGYAESWSVFWICAHFLSGAAKFSEMGVEF